VAFSIRLLPETVDDSEVGNAGQYGEIELDDYRETFIAIIGFWSPHDYQNQWREAITRLVERRERSCLITSLHDPAVSEMLWWWLLYIEDDQVAVQNAILLFSELPKPFSTGDPYASIPAHRTMNEEGLEIVEWRLPLMHFEEFHRVL